jgi:uncharacterized integral membrane protein
MATGTSAPLPDGPWPPPGEPGQDGPAAQGPPATASSGPDGGDQPGSPPAGEPAAGPGTPVPISDGTARQHRHVIRRTRIGGLWLASALFALVLLLLLIFILQNGTKVQISYLGMSGHLPLGVALLLAAVLGILLVVVPGTGRIIQLRRAARHRHPVQPHPAGQFATGPAQASPAQASPAQASPGITPGERPAGT